MEWLFYSELVADCKLLIPKLESKQDVQQAFAESAGQEIEREHPIVRPFTTMTFSGNSAIRLLPSQLGASLRSN